MAVPNVKLGLTVAGWINEHVIGPVRPVAEAAAGAVRGAGAVLRGESAAQVRETVDPEKERLRKAGRTSTLLWLAGGVAAGLGVIYLARRRR